LEFSSEKSYEKSLSHEILRKIPREVIFSAEKKCPKNWLQVNLIRQKNGFTSPENTDSVGLMLKKVISDQTTRKDMAAVTQAAWGRFHQSVPDEIYGLQILRCSNICLVSTKDLNQTPVDEIVSNACRRK
jgi:hypothetical protein